ncbi:MAG: hypothetical protein CBC48_17240 [bacterium TMED88]|nr:hypothetical protein [Deltaproteobacteria bacterium]OUV24698.1 MAG: hypothetical protein CBC48_17240 [bacterium TMED88]
MSNYIRTDVAFSIKENVLDEFKNLIGKMVRNTESKEPDALVYEWYLSENGLECHLLETFKDSDAFMVHLDNLSVFLDQLWDLSTLTGFKTFGNPSAELQESLSSFPVPIQYFSHTDGLTRD